MKRTPTRFERLAGQQQTDTSPVGAGTVRDAIHVHKGASRYLGIYISYIASCCKCMQNLSAICAI